MTLRQRVGLIFFILGICGFFDMKYSGKITEWIILFLFAHLLGIALFIINDKNK